MWSAQIKSCFCFCLHWNWFSINLCCNARSTVSVVVETSLCIYYHNNCIRKNSFVSVSQSWSRRSSTTCGRCGSWRGCTDGGCRRRWCWRLAWFTPSSPVWTSCWTSTPASCQSCWTRERRDWWRAAPPTSSSAASETCCSDRYGSSGDRLRGSEDLLRVSGFECSGLMFQGCVDLKFSFETVSFPHTLSCSTISHVILNPLAVSVPNPCGMYFCKSTAVVKV